LATKLAPKFISSGLTILFALMPFHAFLSVVLGHYLGHQTIIQAWKEILIVVLAIASLAVLAANKDSLRQLINPINLVAAAYVGLSILVSFLTKQAGTTAWWFGVKTNLAFLAVFVVAQIAANQGLKRHLAKLLLGTSAIVAILALIQTLILPVDWLSALGYGPDTIRPLQLVDPAVSAKRAFSTLGGPNQLGAFLILPISFVLHLLLTRRRWWQLPLLVLLLSALVMTFSRSAWMGAIASVLAVIALHLPPKRLPLILAVAGVTILTLAVSLLVLSRRPGPIQYFILHSQGQTYGQQGSDSERLESLRTGLDHSLRHPLGRGLGSAGPASLRGNQGLITENYYLQIAIESGLAGLTLFLALTALVGAKLLSLRHHHGLAGPLFASLLGVSIVNLFLHGWADSTLTYMYWTLAGAVIGTSYVEASTV
jgi:O-antigen ligase